MPDILLHPHQNPKPVIQHRPAQAPREEDVLSILPLGGVEDIQKNMYLYQYKDEILIVDCGIGFADETMLGVDLLLPDIEYLRTTKKRIVGMVLSHGHEDHIGALPFILPRLPNDFPIYATPLTAALANAKLKDFKLPERVQTVEFSNPIVRMGSFSTEFIQITHSVPDSSHIFIKSPVGNFYHGADYKFDLTPVDGHPTDFQRISKTSQEGVLCLLSDCLGAGRPGHTPTEIGIQANFERELRECKGKFIITTFSSHISRLNQVVAVTEKLGRKICFIGRSMEKTKELAVKMGYLHMKPTTEIPMDQLRNYKDHQVVLVIAGSQGQENSALSRIANNEHREVHLRLHDVVVFSSDAIPGSEVSIGLLIDEIEKRGAKVINNRGNHDYHVSGHGSDEDNKLLIALTKPKYLLPISGSYRNMTAYAGLAESMGYDRKSIFLIQDGQEILFGRNSVRLGKKYGINNVYVDQLSGEEVESYMLRDREKLAKEGIIILMVEVAASNGQLVGKPEVVMRGFSAADNQEIADMLSKDIQTGLTSSKGSVKNWVHIRKLVAEIAGKKLFREFRRRPLVLPVIIEV